MRIKWNRHLDGSTSRQEGSETQETEEKKSGSSSSPGIFRIFRRKKNKKREDDDKVGTSNFDGTVPPLCAEGEEDDNASISSVATCASQPATEIRQRDRANSLFSSFRLSLPGSKRKKRRIAPTPSETLINKPEDDHQVERYSTPDLRKPSEKLDVPNDVQASLSNSSPSVRNPKESSRNHSLDKNIECVGKNKSLNSSSALSNSKLSKSVSFSNCGGDLNDFAHSSRDKNSPRAVESSAMVEEDAGALESELADCMTDNLRKNHEGKSAANYHSSFTTVSKLQKQPDDETVSMTKTEKSSSPGAVNDGNISNISSILNDIASEIRNYRKPKDGPEICNAKYPDQRDIVSTPESCALKNNEHECNNSVSATTEVLYLDRESNKNGAMHVRSNSAFNPEVGSVVLPKQEWNTLLEVCNNNNHNISLLSDGNNSIFHESDSVKPFTQLSVNENAQNSPTLKSSVATLPKDFRSLNSVAENFEGGDVEETKFNQTKFPHLNAINIDKECDKQSIENTKHVICHMRVYENKTVPGEVIGLHSDRAELTTNENEGKEISCEFLTVSNSQQKIDINCALNNKHALKSKSLSNSLPCITSCSDPEIKHRSAAQLIRDLNMNDPPKMVSSGNLTKIENDQEVPNCKYELFKRAEFNDSLPFHEVPEFELSLLEFEEMCNKYTSPRNFEFCEYNSIIPQYYGGSPKPKSVLDTDLSFAYPRFNENSKLKINSEDTGSDIISPVLSPRIKLIKQNIKVCEELEDACQSVTDKCILPLPPKQWINYEKATENKYNSDVCTGKVQCTAACGKNLCQEPCPEASLPTAVMPDDFDSVGMDTPEVSSTLRTVKNKSGRECISNVPSEISQSPHHNIVDRKDMVSDVGLASTQNGNLDYACVSKSFGKSAPYLESQINDSFCCARSSGDVYSEVTKELESLGSTGYLNGHNFSDMKSVKLRNIINDVPREFVQGSTGLIEISNPYQVDLFAIGDESSSQVFINEVAFKQSSDISDVINEPERAKSKDIPIDNKRKLIEKQKSREKSLGVQENGKNVTINNKPKVVLNGGSNAKQNKLSTTEQKNMINKNSMIPCLKKNHIDIELKRTDSKSKTNIIPPGHHKSEVVVPAQQISSRRVLSNQSKDPPVDSSVSKHKKYSKNHHNRIASDVVVAPLIKSEISKPKKTKITKSDFNVEIFVDKNSRTPGVNDANTIDSDCTWIISDYSSDAGALNKEIEYNPVELNFVPPEFSSIDSKILLTPVFIAENETNSCESSKISCIQPVPEYSKDSILNGSTHPVPASESKNFDLGDGFYSDLYHGNDYTEQDENLPENYANGQIDRKYEDCDTSSRKSSITGVSLLKKNFTSSKESLNSQLTTSSKRSCGKSRIPTKQSGARGAQPSSKGPVRPPMWLSKAELTQEIQRLGTLCEARTKELNRLKMETKHVSSGFDAFAALFKYMVEDLNGLSVPTLTEDLEKTLKQLELTKQDLAYYEREVEEIKSHHCQELNDLSNKLFEVYQSEVAELNAKHQEEINHLKNEHQTQMEHLTSTFDASSTEAKTHHEKLIASLEQEIINQREELQLFQEREIKDLEEKHVESSKILQDHIEQLQKKCAELKQHSMTLEDAMRKDTDSKLQWVTSVKVDLEKEVESLKAVLEMKNKELHTLRVQNLEMEKQLEELPLAREKIKMLQARAEDLEALMIEKTNAERKLSTEYQHVRDTYEKEAKMNRRLSMENEELQWRLRQAENSLISGSFAEVPEFTEEVENAAVASATSPTKSPGPQMMSRSVFFTFVDKDESMPHSPRSQYKKITPNFSANYKASPVKSSKSPPAPSPRRAKSHSEPPQPLAITSTPKKNAKQLLCKVKGPQKRQRSGSDSGRLSEHMEVTFSSVTESMASSVSSDSSVFEHKERLLEEHKEHIIQSLEILREQRSSESADENTLVEKKWSSDDIKITGELSKVETNDMSRSAEFADPKSYYHMTFPVLKEAGINDCDIEDGSKNVSSDNSPMKEIMSNTMHSMSEDNIHHTVETDGLITQAMSKSSHEVSAVIIDESTPTSDCSESINRRNSNSESSVAIENVQSDKVENRWRTI